MSTLYLFDAIISISPPPPTLHEAGKSRVVQRRVYAFFLQGAPHKPLSTRLACIEEAKRTESYRPSSTDYLPTCFKSNPPLNNQTNQCWLGLGQDHFSAIPSPLLAISIQLLSKSQQLILVTPPLHPVLSCPVLPCSSASVLQRVHTRPSVRPSLLKLPRELTSHLDCAAPDLPRTIACITANTYRPSACDVAAAYYLSHHSTRRILTHSSRPSHHFPHTTHHKPSTEYGVHTTLQCFP